MSITIKAVKEVSGRGELGYRVSTLSALEKANLPQLYLSSNPHAYQWSEHFIRGKDTQEDYREIRVDYFYVQSHFDEILDWLRASGEALRAVNLKLATLREAWQGDVEINI